MNNLKIGWASRDISTEKPVLIVGQAHLRISQGVRDPLTTTALVIDNSSDLVVFLSVDMVSARSYLLDEIRAAVLERLPEFPVEKILLNATHTHTGVGHYDNSPSGPGEPITPSTPKYQVPHPGVEIASSVDYRRFLVKQCSDAIVEAYEGRTAGGVSYGYGYAVVSHPRRVVYFDDVSKRPGVNSKSTYGGMNGHSVMYGNTNDENFSHYESGADSFINILYTFDTAGKLTGALVNVPCPSQNSEHEYRLSADFWHDVRTLLRQKHGDIFLLPQTAASGDLSPRILHYKEAQDRRFALKYGEDFGKVNGERKDIAERIVAAFDEVLAWAGKDIRDSLPLRHVVKTIDLPRRFISDEELDFAKERLAELDASDYKTDGTPMEQFIFNSTMVSNRNRLRNVIKRYETQQSEPTIPMEMHVLRIGDIAFASNRFELFIDFQHRMQARSPFIQTFVVQLAAQPGDVGGTYLCTERGAAGRGYSATMFCNQVSPQAGNMIVEETVKTLKELHRQD